MQKKRAAVTREQIPLKFSMGVFLRHSEVWYIRRLGKRVKIVQARQRRE